MVWLVTHIWLFIGLAALLGLILGWAVRGIRVSGGARRAVVERDIALTELDQVRAELDSLYTAQRAQGDDPQIYEELQARDAKLGELDAALTAAREELVTYKAESEKKLLAAAAASAVAAGVGTAVVADRSGGSETPAKLDAEVHPANAQMEWRNRYLESRVRSLESVVSNADTPSQAEPESPPIEDMSDRVEELEAGNLALQEQIGTLEQQLQEERDRDHGLAAGVGGAVVGAGAAVAGAAALSNEDVVAEDHSERAERDKLAWQNRYLTQRLQFMEDHGMSARQEAVPTAETVAIPAPKVDVPEIATPAPQVETPPEPASDAGDIEQELARLRWRNRYLEGRLAYIDGGVVAEDGTDADDAKQSAAEALLEKLERSDGTET